MFCFLSTRHVGGILAPQSGTEPPVLEGKILTTGLPGKSPIWPFTENVDWPPNQNCFIRRGLWLRWTAPDHRHQISVKVFDLEVISFCLSASHLRRWLILWSKAGEGGMLCGCWDQLREMGRKKGVGGGHGRQAHQPSSLSQVVAAGDTGHEELWDEEDVPVHGGRGPGSHGVLRCLWVQQEWWLGVSSCGDPDWGTSEFLKLSVGKVNWLLDQRMPPSAPSGPDFPSLPKFTSPPLPHRSLLLSFSSLVHPYPAMMLFNSCPNYHLSPPPECEPHECRVSEGLFCSLQYSTCVQRCLPHRRCLINTYWLNWKNSVSSQIFMGKDPWKGLIPVNLVR